MATSKLGPEVQVVNEIITRSAELGIFLFRVESSAVLNERIGRYLHSQAPKGFPDMSGYDKSGTALFVEAKAPNRLSTIREDQYRFLRTAVQNNCFAVCVDSFEKLKDHYAAYSAIDSKEGKRNFLKSVLPLTKLAKKRKLDHDFSEGVVEF